MTATMNKPGGFDMDPTPDGRPYMGDMAVVSGLVETFYKGVLRARHDYVADAATREASLQLIEDYCSECGDIILGRDPDYQPAPWNGPRLGGTIRALVPGINPQEDMGAEYFRWLAKQVLSVATAMEQGMADEEAGPLLQAGMRQAVRFLLGGG